MTAMPRDPDMANRLMLALGAIIIRYADFEVDMLGAIAAIHERRHELGHDSDPKLPSHLSAPSIEYLRENVTLSGMEPFAAEIERITAKAEEIADIRSFIAHGTLSHFDEGTQTVHFRKYKVNKDRSSHSASRREVTLAKLEAVRDETATMAVEMFDLSDRLERRFLGDT
jgi:hypothetical protein